MFTHYKLVMIRICQKLNQTVNKVAYWDISVDQFQSFCVCVSCFGQKIVHIFIAV